MVSKGVQLEYVISRMITSSPRNRQWLGENFSLLYGVLKTLHGDAIESLDNLRCPVCGKQFSNRYSAVLHLLKAHREYYVRIVASTVNVYMKLMDSIGRRTRDIVLRLNGVKMRFESRRQLAEYLEEHPEVLEQFDVW